MEHYYYLVAQLPYISDSEGAELPISYERFVDLASRWLSEKDMAVLRSLSLEPSTLPCETGSKFLDAWNQWERELRIALAQLRAANMKKEFQSPTISISGTAQQLARTACNCDSPLEAERLINAERMRVLNDLTPIDNFCSDAIFAYGLKLQMVERIGKFNRETGLQSYHTIYDQILGDAK